MGFQQKLSSGFTKLWEGYVEFRDAPQVIGPKKSHIVYVFTVYAASLLLSVYLFTTILQHQPTFSNLVEHSEGRFVAPSLVYCPYPSSIYNYSFWYRDHWIDNINLSIDAVNLLAKASKEKKLTSKKTEEALSKLVKNSPAEGFTPIETWRKISSPQYSEFETFKFIPAHKNPKIPSLFDYDHDMDCIELSGPTFSCYDIRGLWLNDNSYCFFINNTNKEYPFNREIASGGGQISNFAIPHMTRDGNPDTRLWLGNLLVDKIQLPNYKKTFRRFKWINYIPMYVPNKVKQVCQPLLENEKHCDDKEDLEGYWLFMVTKNILGGGKMAIITVKGNNYYTLQNDRTFTNLAMIELFGAIIGVCVGISFFSIIRVLILYFGKLNQKLNKALSVLTVIVTVVLLGVVCWIQYEDVSQALDPTNRFRSELEYVNDISIPYPEIYWGFKQTMGFNYTKFEEHNVSLPLFFWLFATAALRRPQIHIIPHMKSHFLFDKQAPKELGYRWEFLTFPLQSVSQDFYEERMTLVEKEYEELASKFGINHNEPSWQVFEKFLLEPCQLIKFCYIDGRKEATCCQHFRWGTAGDQGESWVYLVFDNGKRLLKQTLPGIEHGLRVVFNGNVIEENMENRPPITSGMYMDSYVKDYFNRCKAEYNCSNEYPSHTLAHRLQMIHVVVHFWTFGESLYYPMMYPGQTRATYFEYTEKQQLEENPLGNCTSKQNIYFKEKLNHYLNEIVYRRCGCYVCIPETAGTLAFATNYIKSCCTPKEAGRCLTRQDMYDHKCWNTSALKEEPLFRAGNLPLDPPTQPLLNYVLHHQCSTDQETLDTMEEPDSAFYEDYAAIRNSEDKSLFYDSCKSENYQGYPGKRAPPKLELEDYSDIHEQVFYFQSLSKMVFREVDLWNGWAFFGLICGSLGIIFGFTIVLPVQLITEGIQKLLTPKLDSESIYESFVRKFRKRFKVILKIPGTSKIHPPSTINKELKVGELVDKKLVELNSNQDGQPNQDQHEVENESEIQPDTGKGKLAEKQSDAGTLNNRANHKKQNGLPTDKIDHVSESSLKEPPRTTQQNDNRAKENEKHKILTGWLHLTKLTVVIAGACLAVYSCMQLQKSLDRDKYGVQYDLKLDGIVPANLAICQKHPEIVQSLSNSAKEIKSFLISCKEKGETRDCGDLFPLLIRGPQHDCILTTSELERKRNTAEPDIFVDAEWNSRLSTWAGSLQSIRQAYINADTPLVKGGMINPKYEHWDVLDHEICKNDLKEKFPCPVCHKHEKLCCSEEGIETYNLTLLASGKKAAFCRFHAYSIFYDTKEKESRSENRTLIVLESQLTVKRLITRAERRSMSQILTFFAGYIDLFIGVNFDNVIFTLTSALLNIFV